MYTYALYVLCIRIYKLSPNRCVFAIWSLTPWMSVCCLYGTKNVVIDMCTGAPKHKDDLSSIGWLQGDECFDIFDVWKRFRMSFFMISYFANVWPVLVIFDATLNFWDSFLLVNTLNVAPVCQGNTCLLMTTTWLQMPLQPETKLGIQQRTFI